MDSDRSFSLKKAARAAMILLAVMMGSIFTANAQSPLAPQDDSGAAVANAAAHAGGAAADTQGRESVSDLLDFGDHYLAIRKANAAIAFYYRGLVAAREANSLPDVLRGLKGLSDAYAANDDPRRALLHFHEFTDLKDSFTKAYVEREMADMGAQLAAARQQVAAAADKEKNENPADLKRYLMAHQPLAGAIIALASLSLLLLVVMVSQAVALKKRKRAVAPAPAGPAGPAIDPAAIAQLQKGIDDHAQLALLQQMNPAFIAAALAAIRNYNLQNNKLVSEKYLSGLAKLEEKILENSKKEYIPLGKELEVIDLYVDLEVLRLNEPINCNWGMNREEDLVQYKVPPLLLQPFVASAVNCKVAPGTEKIITLTVSRDGGNLAFVVENNGTPPDAGSMAALGLKIAAKRIEMLNAAHQMGIAVETTPLTGSGGKIAGSRVRLTCPVKE